MRKCLEGLDVFNNLILVTVLRVYTSIEIYKIIYSMYVSFL